jgi:ribonuclease R
MSKKFYLKKDPEAELEAKRYSNPIASRQYIIDFLKCKTSPTGHKSIEKQFNIKSTIQQDALDKRLKAMVRDGQITQDKDNKYTLLKNLQIITSLVLFDKNIGIYVATPNDKKIPIQPRFNNVLFVGDEAKFKILPKSKHNPECAILVEVFNRKHRTVTGLYKEKNGVGFIESSLKAFKTGVIVNKESISAKVGEYVVADIVSYPELNQPNCIATITKVLGDTSVKGVELEVALSSHDIPHTWPNNIYDEIAQLKHKIPVKEIDTRKDLRDLPFVTIDGEDSRDFDDAVYAENLEDGGYKLYVAIADVSYYVRPGTNLDQEALKRATSVYFPREVVPMLPEVLSNDLCSLVPNKDRLAMVAEVDVDENGELVNFNFYRGIIKSHARLTYNKVYQMLEGSIKIPSFLQQPLANLHHLYRLLSTLRNKRGAIEFNTSESRLIFNKDGKIDKIVASSRNVAHMIIEECMLLANNAAALFLAKHESPTLYRVHAAPELSKIKQLGPFLSYFGINAKLGKNISANDYNSIITEAKGKSYEHVVNVVLLRTMQQAVYQPENIGHYGLAYDFYLHFTSPIRRYPDLIVHRCLGAIIDKKQNPFSYKKLIDLGQHCSTAERRAEYASRDVEAWLKCCYMQDKLGVSYNGVITSVTNFGLFVEIDDIHIDGLVHISNLGDDYYDFDPELNSIIGRKTKQKFTIGSKIRVKVAKVDVNSKFIDFEPINIKK